MPNISIMRILYGLASTCAFAVCSPTFAGPAGDTSWGKADVSLVQYATDATECAETSRYVKTHIEARTLRSLDALSSANMIDLVMGMGLSPDASALAIVAGITHLNAEDDIARRSNTFGARYVAIVSVDVAEQLQAIIDKCLIHRGYVRIKLTGSQFAALHKLKRHSPERTAYLHSIDSNALLISQQKIETIG
jgi:hypothetical protein